MLATLDAVFGASATDEKSLLRFLTCGSVLSDGFVSYQRWTGVAPFQPSSDKSPSTRIAPAAHARAMASMLLPRPEISMASDSGRADSLISG